MTGDEFGGKVALLVNGVSTSTYDIQRAAALLMLETGEPHMLEAVRALVRERNQARENYLLNRKTRE